MNYPDREAYLKLPVHSSLTPLFKAPGKRKALLHDDAWELIFKNPALAKRLKEGCVLELTIEELAAEISRNWSGARKGAFALLKESASRYTVGEVHYLDRDKKWNEAPKELWEFQIGDRIQWIDLVSGNLRDGQLIALPEWYLGNITMQTYAMEDTVGFKIRKELLLGKDFNVMHRGPGLMGGPTPNDGEFPALTEDERCKLNDLLEVYPRQIESVEELIFDTEEHSKALQENLAIPGLSEDERQELDEQLAIAMTHLDELETEHDTLYSRSNCAKELDTLDQCALVLNDYTEPTWRRAAARWACHCCASDLEVKLFEIGLTEVEPRMLPYYCYVPPKLLSTEFFGAAEKFIEDKYPDIVWREKQNVLQDLLMHPHLDPEETIAASIHKQRLARIVDEGYKAKASLECEIHEMPRIWQDAISGNFSARFLTRAETDSATAEIFLDYMRKMGAIEELFLYKEQRQSAENELSKLPARLKLLTDSEAVFNAPRR